MDVDPETETFEAPVDDSDTSQQTIDHKNNVPSASASPALPSSASSSSPPLNGTDEAPRGHHASDSADTKSSKQNVVVKTEKTEPLTINTISGASPLNALTPQTCTTTTTTTIVVSSTSLPPQSALPAAPDSSLSKDTSGNGLLSPSLSSPPHPSLSATTNHLLSNPPSSSVLMPAPTAPAIVRGTLTGGSPSVHVAAVRTKRAVVLPQAKFEESAMKRPRSMDGKLLVGGDLSVGANVLNNDGVLTPTNTIPCQRGCTTVFTYTGGDPSSLRRAKEARSKHHQRRHKREKDPGSASAAATAASSSSSSSSSPAVTSTPRPASDDSHDTSRHVHRAGSPKRPAVDNTAQCNHCCPHHCGPPPPHAAAAVNAVRTAALQAQQNMNQLRQLSMPPPNLPSMPQAPQGIPFLGHHMGGPMVPNMMYPAGIPNYPPFDPRLYDPRLVFSMFPPVHAVPPGPIPPMLDMYAQQQYPNQLDMLAQSAHPVPFANSQSYPQPQPPPSSTLAGSAVPPFAGAPPAGAGSSGSNGMPRSQALPPPQPRVPPPSSSSSVSDADSGSEKTV